MKSEANIVFEHLTDSDKRFIIEQGGTRSGKTYNILMWLISYCFKNTGKTITICRKTLPSLKGSAYRDFIEILTTLEYYEATDHNKTESFYNLNGNLIEFIAIDQAQKIRGRKRNLLFINEANEITYEEFFQLNMRTTDRVIIDYNPSEEFWIEQIKVRDDADFHITTYLDNPFLPTVLVREIERIKDVDADYWRVYGLGLQGYIRGQIFMNWKESNKFPDSVKWTCYGLDFGFTNDPTALVKVGISDGELHVEELIYEHGLTNDDICKKLTELGLDRTDVIVADSAEPKSIEEIYRQGFNVRGVTKGKDSILNGIDILKRQPLIVCGESLNLKKEFKNYKWQSDKNGNHINKPIDFYNHALDALRYVGLFKLKIVNAGKYTVR